MSIKSPFEKKSDPGAHALVSNIGHSFLLIILVRKDGPSMKQMSVPRCDSVLIAKITGTHLLSVYIELWNGDN